MNESKPTVPVAELIDDAPRPRLHRRVVILLAIILVIAPFTAVILHLLVDRNGKAPASAQARLQADATLEQFQQAYLHSEGHARRGARFEQLALRLNSEMVPGRGPVRALTEAQMFHYLGPPDLCRQNAGRTSYIYFYDRVATRDWYVIVDVNILKMISLIGWNATSAGNFAGFTQFGGAKITPTKSPGSAPGTTTAD